MSNKKEKQVISVIIPVYNVVDYLPRCIDSVIGQTYTNLDIVLVDDGSTDGSRKIIEKYKECDKRIQVVLKKNGGLSEARNAGLKTAKGEYVTFVDSDDWISENYISRLYELVLKYDADISVAELEETYSFDGFRFNNYGEELVFDNLKGLEAILYFKMPHSACAKLYRRKIVDSISFPVGKLYEDWLYSYDVFKHAHKSVYTKDVVYAHYVRRGSIGRSNFSPRHMDIHSNICEIINDVSVYYPQLEMAAKEKRMWADIFLIFKILPCRDIYKNEFDLLWREIKDDRKLVICDKKARGANRTLAFLSYGGVYFLYSIYRVSRMRLVIGLKEKYLHKC